MIKKNSKLTRNRGEFSQFDKNIYKKPTANIVSMVKD